MKLSNSFLFLLVLSTILFSCGDDESASTLRGSARFEITDAPIDDASVKSVFVTVTEIKADGKTISGFNKTTIDVLAFQNGDTKFLADTELEAKSYSELTLVLDFESDENGNSPGCYVAEEDGNTKHPLASASNEIKVQADFDVSPGVDANVVIDFDLRKCVQREDDSTDKYEFVSTTEMQSGIRVVSKTEAGVVKGNCNDSVSGSDKVVVYAYKKGTYNRDAEVKGQGQSNIEFANAESSSTVNASGNFQLHFLEKGDYELVYCSYKENAENEMELKGTLVVNVLGGLDVNALSVGAGLSIDVSVVVTGMISI